MKTLSTLTLLLALVTTAASAQLCPTGGVFDSERLYEGTTLTANRCTAEGTLCEEVFFFDLQRPATAVCRDGRWQAQQGAAQLCPQHVFATDEIWTSSGSQPNVCSTDASSVCAGTYFHHLPEGGSGYSTAVCRDGRWQTRQVEEAGLLRAETSTALAAALKDGLKATYSGGGNYLFGPPNLGGPTGGPSGAPGGGDAASPNVSQTNVQIEGVDEADRVKSDGRHLYVLANSQTAREEFAGLRPNVVRVLSIDSDQAQAEALTDIEIALGVRVRASNLFLRSEADQLIVLAHGFRGWGYWFSPLSWQASLTKIASVDVSDPSNPRQEITLTLDGDLISSRRIGDLLYVATRFHPTVPDLDFYSPGDADEARQAARIDDTPLGDLLPKFQKDGQEELLVRPTDCYLPNPDAEVRSSDIISVAAIDLDSLSVVSSKCFIGPTETLYVSLETIVVATTRFGYDLVLDGGNLAVDWRSPKVETDLHTFSLNDGLIEYRATGTVEGHLGWNILRKPFRMSDKGDDLRVITETAELTPNQSPVTVTVLRDDGLGTLQPIAQLPNADQPAPIGKPGEQLYATRFVGDRAYLVTFLMTDPLYVVDLSDSEQPALAGELEITGYSDYLHPVGENYLVGVGKDALPGGDFRGAWFQGVQVSLFDVSDPANPFESDKLVLGRRGSESPVLYDHKAFTFLEVPGELPRIAFGVQVHDRPPPFVGQGPSTFYYWRYSGLRLFEVDTQAGKLLNAGEMRVRSYDPPDTTVPLLGDDRTVLVDDAIVYVHGDDVYTAFWSNPWPFVGPR